MNIKKTKKWKRNLHSVTTGFFLSLCQLLCNRCLKKLITKNVKFYWIYPSDTQWANESILVQNKRDSTPSKTNCKTIQNKQILKHFDLDDIMYVLISFAEFVFFLFSCRFDGMVNSHFFSFRLIEILKEKMCLNEPRTREKPE